jgi:metal-dependent amidase/aminoacylase/carboxypeptidase family protein
MTLRAEKEDRMKNLERQVISYAEEEAKRFGIRTSHSIHDYFPETRNDEHCLEAAIRAASDLGMNVISMKDMWRVFIASLFWKKGGADEILDQMRLLTGGGHAHVFLRRKIEGCSALHPV